MGLLIRFDKEVAVAVIDAVEQKRPLPLIDDANTALLVAGVLVSLAEDAGPQLIENFDKLPLERQEAHVENIKASCESAVQMMAQLARLVRANIYDAHFEGIHEAAVSTSGGRWTALPLTGFKGGNIEELKK
jgi:hypothetical protein